MKVAYLDGHVDEITTIWLDRIAVEKRGLGSAALINSSPSMYLARIAYAALEREHAVNGTSFDDWLPTVVSLDMPDEDETPDPTRPDPGLGSSASSP